MSVTIVAELSGNHLGGIDRAKLLIDMAKRAGADAVKLQTFTADTITVRGDHPSLIIQEGPWKGRTLWGLYNECATPWEWHAELFAEAKRLGLECWSTPFDPTAVDFLEGLGCLRYKVSSFDIENRPLIMRIAQTGKPIIVSCGMADVFLICNFAATFQDDLTLLHCVSEYPSGCDQMNLWVGMDRIRRGKNHIGLSDHSMTNTAAICATALGATMIEKHLCLSRADGGPDAGFSLEPHEFKEMVKAVREAEQACSLPRVQKEPSYQHLKPSLWIVKDLEKGEVVTAEHLAVRRPAQGSPSRFWNDIINKKAQAPIRAPAPARVEMFG
jgi:pseudaminic acid synthase